MPPHREAPYPPPKNRNPRQSGDMRTRFLIKNFGDKLGTDFRIFKKS